MNGINESTDLLLAPPCAPPLGLCTILHLPILYGVWHTKGGVGGGGVYCAMVVQ